jgi:signal peptide peptidase SppA
MKLIDVLTSPWAIQPEKLREIQAIYSAHFRGDKIDIEAIEARLGRPLSNEQQDYEVRDGGVAVLPISGVISNKANMFTRVSGGASAQMLQQQVESMRADPSVRSVVLDLDTPGGNVLGIPSLAESIRALSAEKPTVACCTGTMASAGYWIGSAANAVYISGLTDYVGSIGVVATHAFDPRSASKQTTEITAGKYKRMGSESAPLTAEGKAYIQSQVDEIYRVFVETVAQNRKVSADQVLEHMADGRIFIGQQAIDAGLVDGVSTVDAMVAKLAENPSQFVNRRKAKIAAAGTDHQTAGAAADEPLTDEPVQHVTIEPTIQGVSMDPKELAAKFVAENADAAAIVRAEGAAAERARIQGVREQTMPGHEALIEALAFDGKTTGPEAAVQVLAAERARVSGAAAARAADAPAPVATATETEETAAAPVASMRAPSGFVIDEGQAKLDAEAKAYMSKNPGVDYISAIKAVSK